MLPELHKKSSENNRGVSETRIPVSNVENVLSKEKGNSSKKVRYFWKRFQDWRWFQ